MNIIQPLEVEAEMEGGEDNILKHLKTAHHQHY